MSLEKIISTIPEKTAQERDQMRENAKRLIESGTSQQQEQAKNLLDALDAQEEAEHKALYEKLARMPAAERVVEAFRAVPPTETDIKVIRALIQNPGSTSTELSQVLGWGGKSWHMHFGKMCEAREVYLWPVDHASIATSVENVH